MLGARLLLAHQPQAHREPLDVKPRPDWEVLGGRRQLNSDGWGRRGDIGQGAGKVVWV